MAFGQWDGGLVMRTHNRSFEYRGTSHPSKSSGWRFYNTSLYVVIPPRKYHLRLLFLSSLSFPYFSLSNLSHQTQMQLDNIEKQRFKNSFHCMRKIIKHHGVGTLFSGWGITTAKDCAYYSTYFFVYEGAKQTLQQSDARYVSQAAIPLAGGAAGTSAWLLSYPLDCVRAGLHGQTLKRGVTPTAVQVFQDLVKKQGIRGLFVGVTPTLVRASLVHSVRFSAYEGILWLFRKYGREREEIAEASRRSITNGIFSFRRQERNQ